jgi:phosphoribosylformylglycinamidine (FGAM) synthase-like enzyme
VEDIKVVVMRMMRERSIELSLKLKHSMAREPFEVEMDDITKAMMLEHCRTNSSRILLKY